MRRRVVRFFIIRSGLGLNAISLLWKPVTAHWTCGVSLYISSIKLAHIEHRYYNVLDMFWYRYVTCKKEKNRLFTFFLKNESGSVRSSHLPFKMHYGFRAFNSSLYEHRRANRTDKKGAFMCLRKLFMPIHRDLLRLLLIPELHPKELQPAGFQEVPAGRLTAGCEGHHRRCHRP